MSNNPIPTRFNHAAAAYAYESSVLHAQAFAAREASRLAYAAADQRAQEQAEEVVANTFGPYFEGGGFHHQPGMPFFHAQAGPYQQPQIQMPMQMYGPMDARMQMQPQMYEPMYEHMYGQPQPPMYGQMYGQGHAQGYSPIFNHPAFHAAAEEERRIQRECVRMQVYMQVFPGVYERAYEMAYRNMYGFAQPQLYAQAYLAAARGGVVVGMG